MKYQHTEWTINELLDRLHEKQINLSPDYQRNPVWRSSAQTKLIESIMAGRPLPNFFLLRVGDEKFEMVDGQQRARTIQGYWENRIPGEDRLYFEQRLSASLDQKALRQQFLGQRLSITIIEQLEPNEKIEDFYVLLNSSSLRLNRPELRKAEYYNTRFLTLVRSAIDYPPFQSLELFDPYSLKRMTDFEVASEAIATLKFGISDKKEKVDQLFEDDISELDQSRLFEDFCRVVDIFVKFDQHTRLKRTRLRQKADLYTFFYFIHTHVLREYTCLFHMFQTFLRLAQHIRPSNDECEPLQDYANNCVTQSNSKKARLSRHQILEDLLANTLPTPNKRQTQVLDYFGLPASSLIAVDRLLTFSFADLKNPKQQEFSFAENIDYDLQD